MKSFIIIDGNSILNRAFYGIRTLTNREGIPTNAVYGFINMLLKITETENPDYISVAFDVSRKTFRNDKYAAYKANRTGMPDELAVQLSITKEFLEALNIPVLTKENYEADDILGTVVKFCEENDIQAKVVTGDKDSLQLASDKTEILLVTTKGGQTLTTRYDSQAVYEKYGLTPLEFIDLKGLMGDAGDNIPGVKGVGEVTALSLLKEFRTIDGVYENINSPKIKPSVREKLIRDKEIAYLSKELATIDRNVPVEISLEDAKRRPPKMNTLTDLLKKLEFSALSKRFDIKTGENEVKTEYKEGLLVLEKVSEYFYYLIEGDELFTFYNGEYYKGEISENKPLIKRVFEDKSIKKISYGIKEHIILLNSYGIQYENIDFDIKIAQYVCDPSVSAYRLAAIAYTYLKEEISLEADALSLLPRLKDALLKDMEDKNLSRLFYDIEMPIVRILADMQIRGIKVDIETLKELSASFKEKIDRLEEKIIALAGESFNVNSTKQLGVILFEKLKLPSVKKTKTGYSTDNDVLEQLKNQHEIISYIIEHRSLSKLKSTYIDGFMGFLDKGNILHSKFHQTVTQTGRLSSSEPNLQNIPIKQESGRELRRLFAPVDSDSVFVAADYSQIELRVLAQICSDESLIAAFANNEDIHTQTASKIFNIPADLVTSKMRSDAKTVNFAILYGKTEFTLAKDLNISKNEAKDIINAYLDKYPGIRSYMDNIIEYAKENGYVKTLLGRIRYIKELSDRNYMIRKAGERIALNTPIQGTAADIIKLAMIATARRMKEECVDGRLVLQIHDELVIEVKKEQLDKAREILQESMEKALKLSVPLTVSIGAGSNLYEI